MKKTKIKTETMWCVYGTCGLYCASNHLTKQKAIKHHVEDTHQTSWEECKRIGDRVRKVIIKP